PTARRVEPRRMSLLLSNGMHRLCRRRKERVDGCGGGWLVVDEGAEPEFELDQCPDLVGVVAPAVVVVGDDLADRLFAEPAAFQAGRVEQDLFWQVAQLAA